MENKIFQWQLKDGQPVQVGEQTVTPQTRVLALRLPFWGFVWNRPVAIQVEGNGRSQRLPIPDLTRMILIAASAVTAVAGLLASKKK